MGAVGFLEVSGLVAAIEGLDSMLKTADVEFLTYEKKLGGRLVTIIIKGSVSAVNEAIENAKVRAGRLGKVVASAVIPNPHEEVMRMIRLSAQKLPNVKSGEINGI
ncbi:BMC domain-containing protein [Clostridium sp. SYSU_GA19001]|uniref:BMC domain-containing protein n=1 Tax=Clostridium caldaquaticum TaxID=2940653 RepID=UPI0020774406|nr:BMC domain-containing protein [Clostridium caldaquaticum]MCM8710023.1 BMC domain-containing protein [Clostridium caldaquaticum]